MRRVLLTAFWSGSAGADLTIGLDAMGGATATGSPMAVLLGGVESQDLPQSGLRVFLPTERLAHVDGTPRAAFVPSVVMADAPGRDAVQSVRSRF